MDGGGESVKLITEELNKAGFEIINDGIRELWNPDNEALDRCRSFGENIGKSIK